MTTIALLTQADVMKAIPILTSDAHSVQERIHQIACSTLDHVRAHGDTTGVVALCNALPNGQRVKALAFWFKKFSNSKLILTKGSDKTWTAKLSKQRVDADFDVLSGMETSFADLTDEKSPESMTIKALLSKLTKASTTSENFDGTDIAKVEPAARAWAASVIKLIRDNGLDPNAPKAA